MGAVRVFTPEATVAAPHVNTRTRHASHPYAGGRGDEQRAAGAGTRRRHRPRQERGPSGFARQLAHPPACTGTLLNAPDITTAGLRDRAILAVLPGRALRRCELAALAEWALYWRIHAGGAVAARHEYTPNCRCSACDLASSSQRQPRLGQCNRPEDQAPGYHWQIHFRPTSQGCREHSPPFGGAFQF